MNFVVVTTGKFHYQVFIRLDIFSFGVSAYEICSGTLPWPGGDARAALAHDTPARDIRELDNDIPDRLAEAVMDCIKPDPENRHDTMEAFLRSEPNIQAGQ